MLEGPNLYFPRAAIKLTLDIGGLAAVPEETAAAVRAADRAAERPAREARHRASGSGSRSARWAGWSGRSPTESGTTRLAVRVRPTSDQHQIVVAFPWRHRNRAQVMGTAVAEVLDAVPGGDVDDGGRARRPRGSAAAEPGAAPHTITPRVPVVAVTGTNGKTTTSRMIAHIAPDRRPAGRLVEHRRHLRRRRAGRGRATTRARRAPGGCSPTRRCELAVTETARGGILLKGIGLTRNDVSVVTNVSADHLGLQGIDTLDQLAEVKGVVPKITRKERLGGPERRRPAGLRDARDDQGAALGVLPRPGLAGDPRGAVATAAGPRRSSTAGSPCSCPTADPDPLVELVDVPMTLAGLSRFNVENSLAAASAALAIGIPREVVVEGLRTFLPDAEHNPGRMNFFSLRGERLGRDRPGPQRGRPRGAAGDHERRPPARAAACCSASARSATAPTT